MGKMVHFLQRPAWAKFQSTLGRACVEGQGHGWRYQAFLEKGKLGARLYAPYGPVVDNPEALKEAIESLKADAKKLGAAYLRIEPTGNIKPNEIVYPGLVRVQEKQPEHTQRINLDRPFSEVLAEMRKSLRNLHRNYHKKGLSVRASSDPQDVEHLINLMAKVTERTGMKPHSDDYLRANAHSLIPQSAALMYLVEFEGEVIAASMTFEDEDCRYYAHAAADSEHRKLQPGAILVSQMIEDATNSEKKFFDLYGTVPASKKDHPWFGFSEFKRSFGGVQVDYAGTWELSINPLRYGFTKLVRRALGDKF